MNLVVITGASRSGTTFLGGLLDRASNVASRHEFLTSREFSYISYYNPQHVSLRRDIEERLRQAERLAEGRDLFVDVNCNLTFGLEALRLVRPDAKIFHLVRDGRAVVASNWVRKMYSSYAKGISLVPNTEAELNRWGGYDRFQRLAWQWNHIVSHLRAADVPIIKLEHLLADYDYLKTQLLEPAGIALTKAQWEEGRREKANSSRFKIGDLFRGRPLKLEWTLEREAQFDEICGATMRALGYTGGGATGEAAGVGRSAPLASGRAAE
jgi:hypothetical protein